MLTRGTTLTGLDMMTYAYHIRVLVFIIVKVSEMAYHMFSYAPTRLILISHTCMKVTDKGSLGMSGHKRDTVVGFSDRAIDTAV